MSTSVTVATVLDRREPWLGLASYSEADSELFFGREKEGLDLLRLVRREVLTVLFGPSGTGKTSLLNAGLFPRLRESAFLPIPIRLDHTGDLNYVAQIRARIADDIHSDTARPIEEESLAPPPTQGDQETLWEYLHRVVFWDWRNNPVTPVLVFDQFEEIFTLGRSRAATEEFLTTLADLVENYIPAAVRSRLEANSGVLPFPHDQPKIKAILSLREDFVWRLDGLRKSMPSVMHNRFVITRMNGEQALRAVREPGQGIVEEQVARQIVSFVAASNQSRAVSEDDDVRMDSLQVDPALLSVVCRELNARRVEEGKDQITADLLQKAGTNILDDFYERGFSGVNPAIRVFLEDRLLTASGFRSTVPVEEATVEGIADEDIRTLVDRRLIRVEERLGIPHLELTHDLLTKVVQKSRAERQEREEKDREKKQREADERAKEEERRHAELRRARRLLVIVSGAAVICLLLGLLAFVSYQKAKAARVEAEKQREGAVLQGGIAKRLQKTAEVAAKYAVVQRREAELQGELAKKAEKTAEDALAKVKREEELAKEAAQKAQVETIRRGIYQAQAEFQISPVRGLLLAVDALDASKREQFRCGPSSTCAESAAAALVSFLSQTGGTPLTAHHEPILALSFSADGRLLATADKTGWKLWRVEQLQTPLVERTSPMEIQSMSLSPDGKFVATAAFGQALLFWTDQPEKPPVPIRQPDAYLNNMGPSPSSATFSSDGKLVLASDGLENASVWRLDPVKDPEFVAKIPGGYPVRFASFTSDAESIVTLDSDGKVWKWQLDQLNGKSDQKPTLLGDLNGLITTAFFSGDGRNLLIPRQLNTEGLDEAARFFDLFNWNEASPKGKADVTATQAAAIGQGGNLVAIGGDGGKVQIWLASSGPSRAPNRMWLNLETGVVLFGHEGAVHAVSFSPDGKYIATGGEDRTVRLWPVEQPFAINPAQRRDDWWSRNLEELIHLAAKTAGRNFTCKEWAEFFGDEEYRRTFPELPGPEVGGCPKQSKSN
jgi:WD40 repeat protein